MPHKRNLANDKDGITAVVATILLVAIAVVLAAGIVVIVQVIASERSDAAPAVGITTQEPNDRLVVASAVENANWNRIQIQASLQSGTASEIRMGQADPYVNDAATATGAQVLNARAGVSSESMKIVGKDFLEFCADGSAMGVAVSVYDVEANSRLGTWTFTDIATC